eukprot:TRINITY_DN8915_c0_g1_i1.p1 TRINITY_DN8915_c0_g1~~TRINITY_DN8915_c0_g1_i1.p1  ORF type:complete len:157 (-),score=48.66 TRINITY_DN8915_c0_g1_i1:40-450(-)
MGSDEERKRILQIVVETLQVQSLKTVPLEADNELVANNQRLIPFDPSREEISFHHPVTRICMQLLRSFARGDELREYNKSPALRRCGNEDFEFFSRVVEGPLRLVSMVLQEQAQLWILNGKSVIDQEYNYYKNRIL